MGQNLSGISITGRVGDIVFCRNGLVRKKSASYKITAIRTLENNAEFGAANGATKLLFYAMQPYVFELKDRLAYKRLMSSILEIIKKDVVAARGKRRILNDELIHLKRFNFNANAGANSAFYRTATVDGNRQEALVSVAFGSYTSSSIYAPVGATHYKIVAAAVEVDFSTGETFVKSTESANLSLLTNATLDAPLAIDLSAGFSKPVVVGLGIKFYQSVNGALCLLNDSEFSSFELVEVLV